MCCDVINAEMQHENRSQNYNLLFVAVQLLFSSQAGKTAKLSFYCLKSVNFLLSCPF